MKHALAAAAMPVLLAAGISSAEQPTPKWEIEQPFAPPVMKLAPQGLQRLAAGKPPLFPSRIYMRCPDQDGLFAYKCPECGQSHSPTPVLQFRFTLDVEFTVAAIVAPLQAQGMRVRRGPDGAIQQVATKTCCFFVSARDKCIVIECYHSPDCQVTADGSMELLPGAECISRMETRELSTAATPNERTFETRKCCPDSGPASNMLHLTELQETGGRVQAVIRTYNGDKAVPEALVESNILQRVVSKKAHEYRQIVKIEKRKRANVLELTSHVMETWRVNDDGTCRLVDTQDLNKPAEDSDPGEVR